MAERAPAYPATGADQTFNLLVFGGSQGARFFAEFMPKVIAELAAGPFSRICASPSNAAQKTSRRSRAAYAVARFQV